MKISQEDSLFYQSLSLCRLLMELNRLCFLDSDYYKNNVFKYGDELSKDILHDAETHKSMIQFHSPWTKNQQSGCRSHPLPPQSIALQAF